jgi:hypothetical protein
LSGVLRRKCVVATLGWTRVSFQEIGDERLVFCRERFAGELFKRGLAARPEIEPKFVGEIEQVAPGIAIAARKLFDQLLALVRRRSLSPIVSAIFLLSAVCSKIFRSGAIDGCLLRAPCGLPL